MDQPEATQHITTQGLEHLSTIAAQRLRDDQGHFIETAVNKDPSLDAPLLSVSVNNPFKKILHWLDEIRRKQTTELDFKLKIPLLAWAVIIGILFGALNITQYFQNLQLNSVLSTVLSKYTTTKSVTVIVPTTAPTPILISRIGTLQATYQLNAILSPILLPSPSKGEDQGEGKNSNMIQTPSRYVLVTNLDQITFLQVPNNISLNPYLNKRVLVTGEFNSTTNTITIRTDTSLQYLP